MKFIKTDQQTELLLSGRYFTLCLPCSSEGGKTCDWVSSDQKDGRFQFELNHSLSPYTEESTQLEVTVEAIVELSVLRKTKRFYLRDISKLRETKIH